MKKNIQIAVPKPCHENWDSFTKTSNGGFCTSCNKEVIDFTSWSDERLKAYFTNGRNNTCGRFRMQQLGTYTCDNQQSKRFGWLSVLFAGILMICSSRQVAAQSTTPKQVTEQYQEEDKIGKVRSTEMTVVKVRGVVNSVEERYTMPGVNVVLKGTEQGTVTDADGRFDLTLENLPATPMLVFSFIGCNTVEYPLDVTKSEQEIIINMKYDLIELTGEVIVGGVMACRWYSPRGLWWRVKGIFRF